MKSNKTLKRAVQPELPSPRMWGRDREGGVDKASIKPLDAPDVDGQQDRQHGGIVNAYLEHGAVADARGNPHRNGQPALDLAFTAATVAVEDEAAGASALRARRIERDVERQHAAGGG